MARIRTIKPEFWGDEKLAPLPALARLVFLGLISMADDAGRLVDNVKSIDGFIFPETEETSRDSLDTLASSGRIVRYKSESGQRIIQVANWLKHQKVDKPSRYTLPAVAEPSRELRETVEESPRSDLGPTTGDLLPPTSEQRAQRPPREVLGVQGEQLDAARDELIAKIGGGDTATRAVDDFLADAPAATRYAWARGLIAMLHPLGGKAVPPDTLLLAMQDFLVADREQWPFVGRVFRGFVDDANRPRPIRRPPPSVLDPADALTRWAAETDAKEKAS